MSTDLMLETPIPVPESAGTLAGFRGWVLSDDFPEGVRASFLDGEVIVEMSPQGISYHGHPKLALNSALTQYFEEYELGEIFDDGTLLTNETANISNEPDLTAALWSTIESGRLTATVDARDKFRELELVGTPDLVVEIISRSSVRKDTKVLRERYWLAGIPEYWLVDCRKQEIDFQLLTGTESGYMAAGPREDGMLWSPVLRAHILLTRTLNRAGRWRYRLEIEPSASGDLT